MTTQNNPFVADANSETLAMGAQPDLVQRVAQSAHETIDKLAERAAPQVQRVQEGVSEANAKLHERADQALELGEEWAESLRNTVRENPLTAVAAAVAIGLVVARLTR